MGMRAAGGCIVSGIFFDPGSRRVFQARVGPEPAWVLVTHNLGARPHHCRRIMREWMATEELFSVDFSAITEPASQAA